MIGIRHEDKSPWETRVALVPDDVGALVRQTGVAFQVEDSPRRAFPADAYRAAGASVVGRLADCPVIVGVKEVPPQRIEAGRTYVFFSHTIKGQPASMPMLRRLIELGCQLIDYELIVDDAGRRLVFFGRHAGLAGMVDALWLLGRRWRLEGIETPFAELQQASRYADADAAKAAVAAVARRIERDGLAAPCRPLVCAFAGDGHVSRGAQEIYDLLPLQSVEPGQLASVGGAADVCFKAVFREFDLVEPRQAGARFDLDEYYARPELYRGRFADCLPHLSLLVNGIYWEAKYPRLVTNQALGRLFAGAQAPRLKVIADISCDIEGAVECTVRATDPGNPCYVFDPATHRAMDGIEGPGPVVLAVDTLPCELPVDSSLAFSRALRPFVAGLAQADWTAPLADSGLAPELVGATIVHRGELCAPYRYLEEFL